MTNPKLSVYKVINKSLIAWGIKNENRLRIYYKWELEKRTRSPVIPCIIIDYDNIKREWYVSYIDPTKDLRTCTIDDINGNVSISSFNFIN